MSCRHHKAGLLYPSGVPRTELGFRPINRCCSRRWHRRRVPRRRKRGRRVLSDAPRHFAIEIRVSVFGRAAAVRYYSGHWKIIVQRNFIHLWQSFFIFLEIYHLKNVRWSHEKLTSCKLCKSIKSTTFKCYQWHTCESQDICITPTSHKKTY